MNIKTAIQAKLEERRAAEYLKKCKAATAAAIAALAQEAEETGTDPQAVLNQYIGKTPTKEDARRAQSEGVRALELLRKSKSKSNARFYHNGKPCTGDQLAAAKRAEEKLPAGKAAKPATSTLPKAAPPKAAATASPSPYATAPTDHLVLLVRRGWLSGPDLDGARAELARRGVEIHKSGYSFTHKNAQ